MEALSQPEREPATAPCTAPGAAATGPALTTRDGLVASSQRTMLDAGRPPSFVPGLGQGLQGRRGPPFSLPAQEALQGPRARWQRREMGVLRPALRQQQLQRWQMLRTTGA